MKFKCPSCGQNLMFLPNFAGKKIRCPFCQCKISFPHRVGDELSHDNDLSGLVKTNEASGYKARNSEDPITRIGNDTLIKRGRPNKEKHENIKARGKKYLSDLAISILAISPLFLFSISFGKSDEYDIKILKAVLFVTITLFSIYKFMVPRASNPMISFTICMLLLNSIMWACIVGVISLMFVFPSIRHAAYGMTGRDAHRYDKVLSYWGFSADYAFWFGFFPGLILTVVLGSIFAIRIVLPQENDSCKR